MANEHLQVGDVVRVRLENRLHTIVEIVSSSDDSEWIYEVKPNLIDLPSKKMAESRLTCVWRKGMGNT